jgi:hypothetical protein
LFPQQAPATAGREIIAAAKVKAPIDKYFFIFITPFLLLVLTKKDRFKLAVFFG